MSERIPAETAGRVQAGTIPAFKPPAGLPVGAEVANLNGINVGLRWAYQGIAAVVFPDAATAARWPGFKPV